MLTNNIKGFPGLAQSGHSATSGSSIQVDEGRIAMDPRLMSTVIWSLAIFRAFESPLYDDILRGLAQWDVWDFEEDSLRRLYQVLIQLS